VYVGSNDRIRLISSTTKIVTSRSIASTYFARDVNGNFYYQSGNRVFKIYNYIPACDSKWHHVALTYTDTESSSFTRYFMDGEQVTGSPDRVYIPTNGTSTLIIGRDPSLLPFSGTISDIRIYKRPLSDKEVLTLSQPPLIYSNANVQPSQPTRKSSTYSWVCAMGSFGSSSIHYRNMNDNSWYWSTGSPPFCEMCPVSSYSIIQAATTCSVCPIGTFGRNGSGFSSQSIACPKCEAGTYTQQPGSLSCLDCPAGTWSDSGSSICSSCPDGFYSNIRGANSSSLCTLCPKGSYGGGGTISSCVPCPAGTSGVDSLFVPPKSSSIACRECPAGSYSSSGALECTFCPVGFYSKSSGSISCASCPSGSFGVVPGASNETVACAPCPEGTFNDLTGQTRISCISCPAGTFSNVLGARSSSTCSSCKPGTFSSAGDSSCSPCLEGYYASGNNSAKCTPCPRNIYNDLVGASSITQCISCPSGTITTVSGTSAVSDCIAGAFACPRGTQPKSSDIPAKTLSDCIELSCSFPLQAATDSGIVVSTTSLGTKCIGCSQGTFGSPSSFCSLCKAEEVCPGFMGVPLPNSSSILALSRQLSSWACASDFQGDSISLNSALTRQLPTPAIETVTLDSGSTAVVSAGVGFVAFTFFVLAVRSFSGWFKLYNLQHKSSVLSSRPRQKINDPNSVEVERFEQDRISSIIGSVLESLDAFSLAHHLESGDVVVKNPTALGGAFTIAGVTTLIVLSIILALRRQADNVLTQQSIAVLDAGSLYASKAQPWSKRPSLSAAYSSPSLTQVTQDDSQPRLLRIRALVSGDSDASCGALLPSLWSLEGMSSGDLVYHSSLSSKPCVAGVRKRDTSPRGQASIFQHIWTCSDCLFSSQTMLTFSLPFGCQSIVLEVASAAADESVSIVSSNSDEGIRNGGLISSLEWKVLPLLDVLYDFRPGAFSNSRKGYSLIDGGTTVSRVIVENASSNQSYALFPSTRTTLTVKVSLLLQPYFSRTTLSEKTSVLLLFSNIVGLAGIFSVFGILFQQADKMNNVKTKTKKQVKGVDEKEEYESRQKSGEFNYTKPMSSLKNGIHDNFPILGNIQSDESTKRSEEKTLSTERQNPVYCRENEVLIHQESQPVSNDRVVVDPSNIMIEKLQPEPWLEYSEGGETWFVSPTGESSWELPRGATSIRVK